MPKMNTVEHCHVDYLKIFNKDLTIYNLQFLWEYEPVNAFCWVPLSHTVLNQEKTETDV